jgi:hypothetical protein
MRRSITSALLIGSVVVLTACYQSVDITLHQPGKFKGPTDPLLAKLRSQELPQALNERFKLSQTDR